MQEKSFHRELACHFEVFNIDTCHQTRTIGSAPVDKLYYESNKLYFKLRVYTSAFLHSEYASAFLHSVYTSCIYFGIYLLLYFLSIFRLSSYGEIFWEQIREK